jgi:hypothetical protein
MVGEGVYNSVWYDKPINVQHSLKFIIMRTQRPVVLSIGPFGTLSMNLFATVHTTVCPAVFHCTFKNLKLGIHTNDTYKFSSYIVHKPIRVTAGLRHELSSLA